MTKLEHMRILSKMSKKIKQLESDQDKLIKIVMELVEDVKQLRDKHT